jgi:hypothetical protein
MVPAISHLACALVRPIGRARTANRWVLMAALVAAGLLPGTSAVSATSAAPRLAGLAAAQDAVASSSLRPEVRLRKLHLVRPDLIMYPLAYDIYC